MVGPFGMSSNRGGPQAVNLCRPDDSKSCASCCGLYNVSDGTRATLYSRLDSRTRLFEQVERTPEAIDGFRSLIEHSETFVPLDEAIHVCEFIGFVDTDHRLVGCMLHPCAAGNGNVDLRGLCYYGSLACRSFFCPSSEELPGPYSRAVIRAMDDWHLYGLVATDLDFVFSLFAIIEEIMGHEIDPSFLDRNQPRGLFARMLRWKDSWPSIGSSAVRRSRYYLKRSSSHADKNLTTNTARILECLKFTFDVRKHPTGSEAFILSSVTEFVAAYHECERRLEERS
ncbi:MAG: hypothetical protein FJY85_23000 [Deltaproteobacteria bacterium]|nr:hypothetical protein [Deltaproteobacteria bacterium]